MTWIRRSSRGKGARPLPQLRVTSHGAVTEILIGDGDRHNVLGIREWAAVERTFRDLAASADVRVVVLTGTGSTFCAGFDLHEWQGAPPRAVDAAFAQMEAACTAVEDLPVPVVAKVRGVAAGAGCQLALACDLRVLSRSARIGMPIARLGILTSPSFAARLSLLAGADIARELLYTGRLIHGTEAARVGLATRCVTESRLDRATVSIAESIIRQPPAAISAAKRAVAVGLGPAIEAARRAAGGPSTDHGSFCAGVATFLRS